jgi:hypothetical protein
MAVEDQVKVLEDEFKLIKSELRQTLVSVRYFLMDLKLPPMQEEPAAPPEEIPVANNQAPEPLASGNQNNSPKSNGNGGGTTPGANNPMPQPQNQDVQDIVPKMDEPIEEESNNMEIEDLQDLDIEDPEDNGMTSGEIPSDKKAEDKIEKPDAVPQPNGKDRIPVAGSADSQVNLLANLVRWVSTAVREIGKEQLTAFLDVYAVGGNMSEELKGVILHLAEVVADPVSETHSSEKTPIINEQITLCMEINSLSGQLPDELKKSIRHLMEILIQQTVQTNKADIWSKLLLELNGILSGNTDSLQYLITRESREAEQLKKEQEALEKAENCLENAPQKKAVKPAKLRLVLPGSDGSEQELDLGNLFIASDQEDSEGNGHHKMSV